MQCQILDKELIILLFFRIISGLLFRGGRFFNFALFAYFYEYIIMVRPQKGLFCKLTNKIILYVVLNCSTTYYIL